jgi:hypothetical protein
MLFVVAALDTACCCIERFDFCKRETYHGGWIDETYHGSLIDEDETY